MSQSYPFGVRVVAGLVGTGIDALRRLPGDLPSIGVQLAGSATKAMMQVRGQLADLALRGDELLEPAPEPQEHPAWARFDDEEATGGGSGEAPERARAAEPTDPAAPADTDEPSGAPADTDEPTDPAASADTDEPTDPPAPADPPADTDEPADTPAPADTDEPADTPADR